MVNFCWLQYGIGAEDPLIDYTVFVGRSKLALLVHLARRLVELFLNIGIRFGIGSFGIRLGMGGPVIAIGFRRRREAGRLRGSIHLLRFWTRHCQSIVTAN